jgi:hypothetical protein
MSEEIIQRGLTKGGLWVSNYEYYNLGRTSLKQLKVYGVIPKKNYTFYESYQPDALLVDRNNKGKPLIIAVIEHKKKEKFKSDKDKLSSVRQCNDVAQELGAKIGVATDGSESIWFNPLQKSIKNTYKDRKGKTRSFTYIQNVDGEFLKEKFLITNKEDELNIDKLNDETRNTISIVNNLYNLLDENNSIVITPEPINPMPLAKSVWQDIWIATGKTPEKCLYNVVELFIFKFLSDLEILREPEDFSYLMSLSTKGKDDAYILNYYATVCRKKMFELFPSSPLDGTTIINGTIFVDEYGNANLTQSILFKNSLKKFNDFGKLQNIDEFQGKIDSLRISLLEAKKELDKIIDTENATFEEYELKDLFDLTITTNRSAFTRSFVNDHKGEIPVYNASKTPNFIGYGKIADNLSGIKYFENCLTWNIDGYVGKAFYREGRFTLSEKVIPLILKDEYVGQVDYMYIRSILQKEASKRDLGFTNKAGKARIADIPIKIPLDKNGKFLLKKQKELALNYKRIEDIKEQISEELKSFNESVIEL